MNIPAEDFQVLCPCCQRPVMTVDGDVAGVMLDDFEHKLCGFRGAINSTNPSARDPRKHSPVTTVTDGRLVICGY